MIGKKLFSKSLMALALLGLALFPAIPAQAQSSSTEVQAPSYNVNASMADNLTSLMGKRVYLTLSSGKVMAGNLKAVGNHLVHVEKLEGKEFFDALISIESISAVDTRFRGDQR